MTRVKAVFCSLMSIKACASENSALQNSLSNGAYAGPPYWIIDDAGMNITVFLNMTGYSAPNESATVLAPTIRYQESFTTEQEHVGNKSGNQEETTSKDHYEVHTNEGEASNYILGVPTPSGYNGEAEVSITGHGPGVLTASSVLEASQTTSTNLETSTTSSYTEASTNDDPPGPVANQNPGKNTTYSNVETIASQYSPVSEITTQTARTATDTNYDGEVEVSITGRDPGVLTASSVLEASLTTSNHLETSTITSYPEAPTVDQPGPVANHNPGKNATYSNAEESATSQYSLVSAISTNPEVPPATHNPEMSTTQTSTTATAEEPSESYKTPSYKNKPRLQMDYFTSQLIADTVSKAVAEEIAKKLRAKLVEKLQANQ